MARCSHLKNCPVTNAAFMADSAAEAYGGNSIIAANARLVFATTRCTCDEIRADHVLARVRHRKGRTKFLADARIYLQEHYAHAADRDAIAILRAAQVDAAEVQ